MCAQQYYVHCCTVAVSVYIMLQQYCCTPEKSTALYCTVLYGRTGTCLPVHAGIPVYRFALFTGSFWSCHYRPLNRDIDCTTEWEKLKLSSTSVLI